MSSIANNLTRGTVHNVSLEAVRENLHLFFAKGDIILWEDGKYSVVRTDRGQLYDAPIDPLDAIERLEDQRVSQSNHR